MDTAKLKNPRVSVKERNLMKGALRRVFSRSELRRLIIDKSIIIGYTDNNRPRVKTWCKCNTCGTPTPKSYMEVDHIEPVVPLNGSFQEMSLDEFINRVWCNENLLQAICEVCHDQKTKAENKERRRLKKERK